LLAIASDDQTVRVWDTHKNATMTLPAVHQAPTTGISFSPINKELLASVGFDKRLVFYDMREKRYAVHDSL
jgi:protein NEDD1